MFIELDKSELIRLTMSYIPLPNWSKREKGFLKTRIIWDEPALRLLTEENLWKILRLAQQKEK